MSGNICVQQSLDQVNLCHSSPRVKRMPTAAWSFPQAQPLESEHSSSRMLTVVRLPSDERTNCPSLLSRSLLNDPVVCFYYDNIQNYKELDLYISRTVYGIQSVQWTHIGNSFLPDHQGSAPWDRHRLHYQQWPRSSDPVETRLYHIDTESSRCQAPKAVMHYNPLRDRKLRTSS